MDNSSTFDIYIYIKYADMLHKTATRIRTKINKPATRIRTKVNKTATRIRTKINKTAIYQQYLKKSFSH